MPKKRDDAANIELLLKIFQAIRDEKELLELLGAIFTPSELTTLGERVRIVERLLAGETQRDIAKNIGAGLSTVSRGSRELKYGSGIFSLLFKRIQ